MKRKSLVLASENDTIAIPVVKLIFLTLDSTTMIGNEPVTHELNNKNYKSHFNIP